jgi:MoxR-like ATPase
VTYVCRRLWYVDKDGQHLIQQDELLARSGPVVVLGEPGMGKTELLKALGQADGNVFCRAAQLTNRVRPRNARRRR